jgi:multicomponent Na+:H+ antiporter subunit D
MTAIVLPFVLPLGAAALSTMLGGFPRTRRLLGVLTLTATIVAAVSLLSQVSDGSVLVAHVGAWVWPLGITLVVDLLAAIMVVVSAVMLLAVLVYAIGSPRTEDTATFFHPVYLILAAGVSLSFLTGDLFNLFVAFESHPDRQLRPDHLRRGQGAGSPRDDLHSHQPGGLDAVHHRGRAGLRRHRHGQHGGPVDQLAEVDPGLRAGLGILFLVVFGIKAAIFPLFFWLPDSYPVAPSPVTAIFAGLLTKVGVYAIIRSQTLLFGEPGPSVLLLTVASLTMIVGVMGAIAQDDVKRILSFHIISQIGYMIFGLGLFTVAGLAATVFYVVHHIIVKTTLFLVGGLIEERPGPRPCASSVGCSISARCSPSSSCCPRSAWPGSRPSPGSSPSSP